MKTTQLQADLKKIFHRGAYRIGIYFDHHPHLPSWLKSKGCQWSKTHRCWYMDYCGESFRILKSYPADWILPDGSKMETRVAGKPSREIPPIAKSEYRHPDPNGSDKADHKPLNKAEIPSGLQILESVGKY